MVVNKINVRHIAGFKPEDNAPICSNCDAPESGHVAFKRMKLKAGDIHVFRPRRAFQLSQDTAQLFDMLGVYSPPVIILVESLETAMLKPFDHANTVK